MTGDGGNGNLAQLPRKHQPGKYISLSVFNSSFFGFLSIIYDGLGSRLINGGQYIACEFDKNVF